ncbi:uncharacterized protein F5891DRAFT_1256682 [Suillus fuscotomentosus]|uniref:Uncharacterized protein n=1 Tax=Suillus fuscotomentosus TaxID=1912939 RepID=A0AAD4DU93_9AGAM|nr:uncharacterized protein F5891DRAFT_1256682 [Suillus fuscotomentosus]KAG1893957.1 hypothetical protein F5891DRAFT_1256682 [Suillus fuscotomentosus]
MALLEYLQGFLTMHCERLICAFVYPNPMGHPFLYHANAASVASTHSGIAQSHTGKLGTILDLGPTLSVGPGTWYPVYYIDEMDRTSSCERSRSLAQRESLKKPTASLSRPPKIHATQKFNASSSQLPPPTATTSTLSASAGTAEASGTPSRPHITGTGWRVRFVGWICCMPIQNTDGHH